MGRKGEGKILHRAGCLIKSFLLSMPMFLNGDLALSYHEEPKFWQLKNIIKFN